MPNVSVDLELPRRSWTAIAILFWVFGIPFGVVGVGATIATATSWSTDPLIPAVVCLAMAAVFVPPALLATRISRSRPRMSVNGSEITFEGIGVLTGPLTLPRDGVHSVYVRGAPEQRSRRFPYGESVVSNWYAPDLSLRWNADANVLIVLAEPMALRSAARFGIGMLRFLDGRSGAYWGPTRWSIARGFFARVRDESAARAAFAGWPTRTEPPAEVMAWLHRPKRAGRAAERP